jgi:MinD superfamily P-loop ATPase
VVIRQLKKKIGGETAVIIDSPPGTSCPVISAVKGSDYCILVTEPTPFGLSDLKLAVEVIEKLKIPFGVIINKSDTGNEKTEEFCHERNIRILLKIPFSRELARSYSSGEPIAAKDPGYRKIFRELYSDIEGALS